MDFDKFNLIGQINGEDDDVDRNSWLIISYFSLKLLNNLDCALMLMAEQQMVRVYWVLV